MPFRFFILFTLIPFFTYAQDYEFGKVSKDEVTNNTYAKDSSASAVILHKSRRTYFDHDHPDGWVIITEVHERIKILNKEGLEYATKNVGLYKTAKSKESISAIKAFTFNLENGKIKKTKMKRSSIFDTEVSKRWRKSSFTLPEVKVGSVVEWVYKVKSPFWKIDDLIVQSDIPTAHYFGKVDTPHFFKFNRLVKGGFALKPNEYTEIRNLTVNYEQGTNSALTQATRSSTIKVTENVSEYELSHVPALKEELYVDNIDNYRFLVTYELNSVQFPNSTPEFYSQSWDQVVKTINKSKEFGGQLKKGGYLKEAVEHLKSKSNSQLNLVTLSFNYIKDRMTWNEEKRIVADDGVSKAYKEKTGNVCEINLMLVKLLNEVGVKAHPVLASTRNHGIPVFPTIEGFNYVLACAEIDGKYILMDATEKKSIPGVLPKRILNWEGTIVFPDGSSQKISLYPRKKSINNTIMSVSIAADGSLSGKKTSSYTSLEALDYRNTNKNTSDEEYLETKMNTLGLDDISIFERKNFENFDKPIIESYEFEMDQGVDIISGDMYFSPLFFLKLTSNPFKLEDRRYPVGFVYPFSRKKMINVKLPEGYVVKSIPDPIKIALPDQLGSFLYNINKTEGGLNVLVKLDINAARVPTHSYQDLKEFYKQRVAKETEKIVLEKI